MVYGGDGEKGEENLYVNAVVVWTAITRNYDYIVFMWLTNKGTRNEICIHFTTTVVVVRLSIE